MRVPYMGTTNTGMLIHEPATLTKKARRRRRRRFLLRIFLLYVTSVVPLQNTRLLSKLNYEDQQWDEAYFKRRSEVA